MNYTDQELRELDAWIAERVMGNKRPTGDTCYGPKWLEAYLATIPHYTTDPAAAMMVLVACYNMDMNSYLASFHNFLVRPDHDRSLTPLQICLFAKKLFGGSNE